jgi:hypothetical protein
MVGMAMRQQHPLEVVPVGLEVDRGPVEEPFDEDQRRAFRLVVVAVDQGESAVAAIGDGLDQDRVTPADIRVPTCSRD